MLNANFLVESTTKAERQIHIKLEEACVERGGNSTNHRGVLAEFLDTTIPDKKVLLCHACHNGKCSNPKHLYWGTAAENVEDTISNGNFYRQQKGSEGRTQTEETREKISRSLRGKPSNNPSGIGGGSTKGLTFKRKYKQIWINNGIEQTRIKFDSDVPKGYNRGRL